MKENEAKLSCELIAETGPDGEDTRVEIHVEGRLNAILNAYEQITVRMLNLLRDELGKKGAMAIHAHVQNEAMKEFGIDLEAEAKKAAEEIVGRADKDKRRDALLSILGKTFTADGKEVTE